MNRTRSASTKLATVVLGITMLVIGAATPASAQRVLELPVDTVVRALPGTVTVLAEVPVPENLRGATCTALAEANNQSSSTPATTSSSDRVAPARSSKASKTHRAR